MTWVGLVPLTKQPQNAALDLINSIGIRSSTFKFMHYDGVSGEFIGEITPYVGGATLSHNTGQTVKRSLNLQLGIEDASVIDPIRDRIWVYMTIQDVDWPLGKYMFTSDLQQVTSVGNLASVQLVDEMFRIDQPISSPFTSNDESIPNAVLRLIDELDVQVEIDPAVDASSQVSSPIGSTRGSILTTLSTQGGYFTPWMDNDGKFHMILAIDPETVIPNLDFDTEQRVFRDSITRDTDVLSAPNRFIVIGNGNTVNTSAVVGIYDVPSNAPHSIQNRGFVIPAVTDMQVSSVSAANAAAKAIGVRSNITERINFSTPPDPRHDSYDVILFEGLHWLELGWTMQLTPGGTMNHACVRVYR